MSFKESIIQSVLDTDLYKLTMGQAVKDLYSEVTARYQFINRGRTKFPSDFCTDLQTEIDKMQEFSLTRPEEQFLREKCPYLKAEYIDWFTKYRFNPNQVRISQEELGNLTVNIEGPWKETIFWEVPLMATISELFYKKNGQKPRNGWNNTAINKAKEMKKIEAKYVEFGTRRRFSRTVQKTILEKIRENCGEEFLGTSNVSFAREMGLTPRGTYAHEWVMGIAGVEGVETANSVAMDKWNREFGSSLTTALTDTYTTPIFLMDYDKRRSQQFPSLRQDSGDPEKWTDLVVAHVKKLGEDPAKFTVMYSDALDIPKIRHLQSVAKEKRINCIFGIGTNLTNDVGSQPLNMVIKMTGVKIPGKDWVNVIKLSDSIGKNSGDPAEIGRIKNKLKI